MYGMFRILIGAGAWNGPIAGGSIATMDVCTVPLRKISSSAAVGLVTWSHIKFIAKSRRAQVQQQGSGFVAIQDYMANIRGHNAT